MIKRFLFSALFGACSLISFSQTYTSESAYALELRGSSWLGDVTEIGWALGCYNDKPGEIYSQLVLRNINNYQFLDIAPDSKLILKVGGNPMVLTTVDGTNWNGSSSVVPVSPRTTNHITVAYYEITPEQADSINTFGITKYRMQMTHKVYERDELNSQKIAKKMKAKYDYLFGKLSKTYKQVNDLSDF